MTKRTNQTLALLVALLAAPVNLSAQVISGRPFSTGARSVYYSWDIKDSSGSRTLTQLVIPVNGFVPLGENLELLYYVASSSNDLQTFQHNYSLSGATDARLQINRSLADDRILLSGGVNLPTGKRELDINTDTVIINLLAENYLNLPTRRFGQGFGFNLLLGGATMLGSARASAGIMYEFTGSYEPYKDQGAYNPGDFISLTAGIDLQRRKSALFADLAVTIHSSDRFDGERVFKQSPQAALRVGGSRRIRSYQGDLILSYVLRGRNTRYASDETISSQLQLFGDEFRVSGDVRWFFARGWALIPSVELKLISANEERGSGKLGSSHIFGAGGDIGRNLGKNLKLNVGAKYFNGRADDGAIDIQGFRLTANISSTF